MTYYNEWEPFAAEWLRNLIKAGLIPAGDVDERSITEVKPSDLRGYSQCHFFAGIGGWSLALELAGVPESTRLFTGSCPCQPFSSAGEQKGFADERHLWPAFFNLIRECQPPVVFGEQVASAIRLGWMDAVQRDLESEAYAVGFGVLGAHSVQAPHQRQRLYWAGILADADQQRGEPDRIGSGGKGARAQDSEGRHGVELHRGAGAPDGLVNPESGGRLRDGEHRKAAGGMGVADPSGLGHAEHGGSLPPESGERRGDSGSPHENFWSDCEWLPCKDGVWRPVESVPVEMADGFPDGLGLVRDGDRAYVSPLVQETKNLAGRLKGYGNSIVPPLAAEFIRAAIGLPDDYTRQSDTQAEKPEHSDLR